MDTQVYIEAPVTVGRWSQTVTPPESLLDTKLIYANTIHRS